MRARENTHHATVALPIKCSSRSLNTTSEVTVSEGSATHLEFVSPAVKLYPRHRREALWTVADCSPTCLPTTPVLTVMLQPSQASESFPSSHSALSPPV
jgi:hypothetical protein